MPYLRLSSLPLDADTKRHLADELTATVLDILTDQKAEWTTVHFTEFEPGDFAVAGRLVADGAIADTHLDISAVDVDEKRWFALRNRLTDVLIEALGIPDSERWHVNVKLSAYDPHTFAIAGRASDEFDGAGHLDEEASEVGGGSSPARRIITVLGFVAGAAVAYRWLSGRLRGDAIVDVAEPVLEPRGDALDAGVPDPRTTTAPAAPAREY